MGPSELKWILEAVGPWFDRLRGRTDMVSAREEEAIRAFLQAMQETRFFLRGEGRKDPALLDQQQRRLSDLWLEAARLVRGFDQELAQRCDSKARYWSDPAGWQPADLTESNILIESMEQAGRQLLARRVR